MATVTVSQPHSLSTEEAKSRLGDLEEMLRKYGVTLDWSGDSASFKSIGVSGGLDVRPSTVDVRVKLGMMAKAAGVDAQRLEQSIRKRLGAALDDA